MHADDLVMYAAGINDECDRGELIERVSEFLEPLQFNVQVENIDGETFKLLDIGYDELRALYFDLRVRHGLDGQDAIEYLWKLTES